MMPVELSEKLPVWIGYIVLSMLIWVRPSTRSECCTTIPEDMTDAEFASFFATVINRIAYASLEDPKIDSDGQASFHIQWCPHQDHYEAFDCRVQRYFVQGMIDAGQDHAKRLGLQVRFDYTIPAGAETCHFTMWRASDEERKQWELLTEKLERKALRVVQDS
jgi:hypothetical protein